MSKGRIEIRTPVSVELYKDENAMKEASGAVIGDFVTTALANEAARKINSHDRLADENAALRETLRLKELECEGLAHDNSVLLSFVKCVSELDIEDWNYETDDGDGMCFEFIADTEVACDAADLLEEMSNEKQTR